MPRKKAVKKEEEKPVVTYIGEGAVSGEYLFKEIPGSVSARSVEEATEKAIDLFNRGYGR